MKLPRLIFEELRRLPNPPRLHPNGFIQLDLDDAGRTRLHIWPEEPIRIRMPDAPIHDHIFGFESRVLIGCLTNMTYAIEADPAGEYEVWGVAPYAAARRDAPLERLDDLRYRLKVVEERRVCAGSRYDFPPLAFHESRAEGFTATVIEMTDFDPKRQARVVCRVGEVPLGTFRRIGAPEEQARLWHEIARVCRAFA